MWLQMPLPSELGVNLVFMRRSCALEDNPPPLTMGRGRIMGSLLFLRRSCEYRHAAVEAFRNARAMPSGSERTVARVLARGLRDLARAEAWLEGQRSHLSVPKAAASPLSEADMSDCRSYTRSQQVYDGHHFVRCAVCWGWFDRSNSAAVAQHRGLLPHPVENLRTAWADEDE
jgi:hypothetical protein